MEAHVYNSPVDQYLKRVHARHLDDLSGAVADYIPELADADPDLFGISIVTVEGARYSAGDAHHLFTIQSISKPLTFALALEERGEDFVSRRIGVEPSGDAFNSITLSPKTGTPPNPMVNAGAIAAVGLLDRAQNPPPLERILTAYARYTGRPVEVDEAVRASESGKGDRNRAIAHLLRSSGAITEDPQAVVEDYFAQCSTLVDCQDLAMIAATLANGGVNPVTGERAAQEHTVRNMLSVMLSCGMYDHAGDWLYTVGLPAKSGVAGGIIAVLPGELGIGVFSPRLDEAGNSVRGVSVCEDMSRELELHSIQTAHRPPSPVRASYPLSSVHSKRVRLPEQQAMLEQVGSEAGAFELQGELTFTQFEQVARAVQESGVRLAVIDLRRVSRIDDTSQAMLDDLAASLVEKGGQIVLSSAKHLDGQLESLVVCTQRFAELDLALEWCEEQLLAGDEMPSEPASMTLGEHPILAGLDDDELEQLRQLLSRHEVAAGHRAFEDKDTVSDEMLLVLSGRLSVYLEINPGEPRRITTVGPGATLGEVAFLTGSPRAGRFVADTDVECAQLTRPMLDQLRGSDPALQAKLLSNMLTQVAGQVINIRTEIAAILN